ncbi:hypothetical protein M513_03068 [Trichuris suis]|uniref:DDE-1 domain-containing protein n=1 Tax=Trichuris suis TaxID=68888 RepID=A0A085MFE8_9BILA|nr:hypothetical protein M513_03068 [Trichuris suis]
MFFWSRGYSSMKVCIGELGINKSVTCRWNRYIREVAAKALAELPVQFGGQSQTVQLDEMVFCRSKQLHLCEFMWRKRLASGDDPFEKLPQGIAKLYPPHLRTEV